MIRAAHLARAQYLTRLAARLNTEPESRDAAGEIIWGATVHAVSAADPEHGTGEHMAPNNIRRFNAAANRIANSELTIADLQDCLTNNQGGRHNHFYHGNLTERGLRDRLTIGFAHLRRLIRTAADSLAASEQ